MESVLVLPTEQEFMSESANKDYKLQAKCYHTNAWNLNSLDFRDPTQHSNSISPSLKRKLSWQRDTPNQRRRVESTITGRSLDNGTLLEGPLTLINLASDYSTGDFDENEIKDAGVEITGRKQGRRKKGRVRAKVCSRKEM